MLKKIPQLKETLTPASAAPMEVVEQINTYIERHSCETLDIDISFMNVIDACYVSTLWATKHFTKYPQGKINWKVSSKSIQDFNKDLELGNNNYIL